MKTQKKKHSNSRPMECNWKDRWNALTPDQRRCVMDRSGNFNGPRWAELVTVMACSTYDRLTAIQQDALPALFDAALMRGLS